MIPAIYQRPVVLFSPRSRPAAGSFSWRRWVTRLAGWTAFLLLVSVLSVATVDAGDPHPGCQPYQVTSYSPTGVVGCRVYGTGTASMWGGPGVARNDCVWPWTACQPIAIRSLETGIVIRVTPRMFGDLFTGTAAERIVDLDPAAVTALGLDPARGLWPVEVWPIDASYSGAGDGRDAAAMPPAPAMADTAVAD